MLKFLLSIFFAWLLYKLIFDLILPGYKVAKQVRKQMSDIQQHMREQHDPQNEAQQYSRPSPSQQQPVEKGDYIDFEEIKK